jgi:hypothetical protein
MPEIEPETKVASERKAWVGESWFCLDDDNILCVSVVGDIDEDITARMLETVICLREIVEGEVNVLIDLNNVFNTSRGARKIGIKRFQDEKVGRVALWGIHPVAKVIASFVIGITAKKDIQFFETKEKALAWLKE